MWETKADHFDKRETMIQLFANITIPIYIFIIA